MKIVTALFLLADAAVSVADISPVRVVDSDAAVQGCSFVGQVTKTNGLAQAKSAARLLQAALQDAAKAGADTAIVRKTAHSAVTVDAYRCATASVK